MHVRPHTRQVGDKVEARDVKGHWYRSTVVALSYTGLQVCVCVCVMCV